MFLAPLPEKTSSSPSSSAAAAVAATSAVAAAASGAILPRLVSRWVDGLVISARRIGIIFVPVLSTAFATSSPVSIGDDSADTAAAVDAAAGLVAESIGLVGPGSALGNRVVDHGWASSSGMKPVSQAPVGQSGNVVGQQRAGHNGGLGGSVPLLDAENGARKLSGNDNSPTMPASPSDSANRTGSRTCCFCWCCCCSCSCITVTNAEETYPARDNNRTEAPRDDVPSPEEVKLWGESFDRLMQSSKGRKYFREFLRTEFSEENVLFWLACEELKRETNPEIVEEKARSIYEDYISILSPKEVSLDSRAREVINRNMVHPSPHTFDEAQLQIYTLMHRDSYPRFLNSAVYKRLIQ